MIALFLDTETTGLDPAVHHLAEVCAVLVDCHDDGTWRVLRALSFLVRDPGPMDAEVQRLTHLTPELCDSHGLSTHAAIGAVQRLADCAEAIVAWNAPFDRAFLEAAGLTTSAQWVDAQRNVDWRALGASRDSLVVVLAEVGRAVNPCPHSALGDVMGMVQLVAPRIREAVEDAKVPRFTVSAVGAAFERKDELKAAGFWWDSGRRVWAIEVREDKVEALCASISHYCRPDVRPATTRPQDN